MEDEERERDVIFAVVATVIFLMALLFLRTSADDEDRRNSAENIVPLA